MNSDDWDISTAGAMTGIGDLSSNGIGTFVNLLVTASATTGVDTAAAGALSLGNVTATSTSVCNSAACDTVTIGSNADADTVTIGDAASDTTTLNGLTVAIDSGDWDITTLGAMTGIAAISADGLVTGTAGLTITGAAVSLNASSNFNINVGTGTSTGDITLGGGTAGQLVSVNSDDWDISTAGAMTGIGAITMDGVLTNSSTTALNGETVFGSAANVAFDIQLVADTTAAVTITPTSSFIQLQCNRAAAADTAITMSETGAAAGQILFMAVDIVNNAGTCSLADSAGVQMGSGATIDDSDTLTLIYTGSEWNQIATSNN